MDTKLIIWGPHKIIWGPHWGSRPQLWEPLNYKIKVTVTEKAGGATRDESKKRDFLRNLGCPSARRNRLNATANYVNDTDLHINHQRIVMSRTPGKRKTQKSAVRRAECSETLRERVNETISTTTGRTH